MEIFKDISGYDGVYQVSNLGRVKSMQRGNDKILLASENGSGYLHVGLSKSGKVKTRTIHQLVSEAFLNYMPRGNTMVINHINFDTKDNRLENLQIVSHRKNTDLKHLKSSSKYVGVCWCKHYKKWTSRIQIDKKSKHLGYYNEEYDAHLAYQHEIKKLK